jgi:hypothetical protein
VTGNNNKIDCTGDQFWASGEAFALSYILF